MAQLPRGAGPLIERVAFDERSIVDDGYGNQMAGPFAEQFKQQASFSWMAGSESVLSAGLESRQPLIIRIRISAQARQITTAWQARDVRRGHAFNIRTITEDPSRAFLDLLVESNVATG